MTDEEFQIFKRMMIAALNLGVQREWFGMGRGENYFRPPNVHYATPANEVRELKSGEIVKVPPSDLSIEEGRDGDLIIEIAFGGCYAKGRLCRDDNKPLLGVIDIRSPPSRREAMLHRDLAFYWGIDEFSIGENDVDFDRGVPQKSSREMAREREARQSLAERDAAKEV